MEQIDSLASVSLPQGHCGYKLSLTTMEGMNGDTVQRLLRKDLF